MNEPISVLFVYQDNHLPSSRVRVLNLIPELQKLDINVTTICFPKKLNDKLQLIRILRCFNVVFLQKKLLSYLDSIYIRFLSKCLVYDFDDAIYYRDDSSSSPYSSSRDHKFRRLAKISDIVIAGNNVLASHAAKFSHCVEVLPSAVPVDGVAVKNTYNGNDQIIIGWVGGGGNIHHLSAIGSVLQDLAKKYNIALHVVSNVQYDLAGVSVVNISWSLEDQEEQIACFDIGVMPLPDNWWTRGKCGYKALQYMASGVPTVCSAVGSNADMIENGVDGFSVVSLIGFHDALRTLINDSDLRRTMGTKARMKVDRVYSIQAIAGKLARILRVGCDPVKK